MRNLTLFLPTRQFARNALALFFALALILGVRSFSERVSSQGGMPKESGLASQNTTQGENVKRDADLDGLKDWEEALWGTDLKNQDTDSDGTPDGEEIKQGRNPLVAGPDDAFASSTPKVGGASSTFTESSGATYTDQLTRQIFGAIIAAKQEGTAINKNEVSSEILGNFFHSYQSGERLVYNESQVVITNDNSTEALKKYGNTVGASITQLSAIGSNDLEIARLALLTEDREKIKGLGKIADSYEDIAQKLASTPAPSRLANTHLSIVNGIAGLSNALADMENLVDDPVVGVAGIAEYKKSLKMISASLQNLRTIFSSASVTFEKSEPGYPLSS